MFELRRITSLEAPLMQLPYPVLHPLARDLVATRLGRTPEQIDDIRRGVGALVVPDAGEPIWGTQTELLSKAPAELPLHTSQALHVALSRVAPDLLEDGSPIWPFIGALPILETELRTRWHGLNYLYAQVSRDVQMVGYRLKMGYAPPGERGNLEHNVDHLFINGRRGISFTTELEGEEPTLNKIRSPYEPTCTSLIDIVNTFAPHLDVIEVLSSPDSVRAEFDESDIVVPTLRALGIAASPL